MTGKDRWIVIPNWEEFQHYKDRDPKWIKLYGSLLQSDDYISLSGHRRAVLHGLWLAYALSHCRVRVNTASLSRRLHLKVTLGDLQALVDASWIEFGDEPQIRSTEWASRYVSDADRAHILDRDSHECVSCGETEHLEIDHILPISQGGTSDLDNLQTLCRRCNRKKHNGASVTDLSSKGLPREEKSKNKSKNPLTPAEAGEQTPREKGTNPRARAAKRKHLGRALAFIRNAGHQYEPFAYQEEIERFNLDTYERHQADELYQALSALTEAEPSPDLATVAATNGTPSLFLDTEPEEDE